MSSSILSILNFNKSIEQLNDLKRTLGCDACNKIVDGSKEDSNKKQENLYRCVNYVCNHIVCSECIANSTGKCAVCSTPIVNTTKTTNSSLPADVEVDKVWKCRSDALNAIFNLINPANKEKDIQSPNHLDTSLDEFRGFMTQNDVDSIQDTSESQSTLRLSVVSDTTENNSLNDTIEDLDTLNLESMRHPPFTSQDVPSETGSRKGIESTLNYPCNSSRNSLSGGYHIKSGTNFMIDLDNSHAEFNYTTNKLRVQQQNDAGEGGDLRMVISKRKKCDSNDSPSDVANSPLISPQTSVNRESDAITVGDTEINSKGNIGPCIQTIRIDGNTQMKTLEIEVQQHTQNTSGDEPPPLMEVKNEGDDVKKTKINRGRPRKKLKGKRRRTKNSAKSTKSSQNKIVSNLKLKTEKVIYNRFGSKLDLSSLDNTKINKKNGKGETLLHRACIKLDFEAVRKLLSLGCEVNTQDNARWTPLHEVAQCGNLRIAELLIHYGALVNVPGGPENFTPLHDASSSGSTSVVKLLIQSGADKNSMDSKGRTPMDIALNETVKKVFRDVDGFSADVMDVRKDNKNPSKSNESVIQSSLICIDLSSFLSKSDMCEMETLRKSDHLNCTMNINDSSHSEDEQSEVNSTLKFEVFKSVDGVPFKWNDYDRKVTHFVYSPDTILEKLRHDCSSQTKCLDSVQNFVLTNECLLQFYMAILSGKAIVPFKWLKESLMSEKFAVEDTTLQSNFEFDKENDVDVVIKHVFSKISNATQSFFNNRLHRRPPLFQNCHVFVQLTSKSDQARRQLGFLHDRISVLLKLGGASILGRIPDPEFIPKSEQALPYHTGLVNESSLKSCTHYVLYCDKFMLSSACQPPDLKYNMSHIKSLPLSWLFRCIVNYSILDPLPQDFHAA